MARSRSQTLSRIQELVLMGRYIVTAHAWQEMREDGLTLPDVEAALLQGRIDREYKDDPRGIRYRVVGPASDLTTRVGVVVRFLLDDRMLIITAFAFERDDG